MLSYVAVDLDPGVQRDIMRSEVGEAELDYGYPRFPISTSLYNFLKNSGIVVEWKTRAPE